MQVQDVVLHTVFGDYYTTATNAKIVELIVKHGDSILVYESNKKAHIMLVEYLQASKRFDAFLVQMEEEKQLGKFFGVAVGK